MPRKTLRPKGAGKIVKAKRLCDDIIRNMLVEKWQFLPRYVVNEKMTPYHPAIKKIGVHEAMSQGNLTLIRAAELWDSTRTRFKTYAINSIYHSIIEVAKGWGLIPVPKYMVSKSAKEYYMQDAHRAASVCHLEDDYKSQFVTYDEDRLMKQEGTVALNMALNNLCELDRKTLQLLIIEGKTLKEVGQMMGGVSKEAIRQRKNRALGYMREMLEVYHDTQG